MKCTPLDTCTHLAIWPGLYVAGSAWYAAQLAEAGPHIVAMVLVFAFMVGVGTYLLDRAKLRDDWLDPADAVAHPRRFAFVQAHSGTIRLGAFGLLGLTVLVAVADAGHTEWWSTIPVVSYAAIAAGPVGSAAFRWAWAGTSAASALALRIAAPRRLRDIVDARLFVEAAIVAATVSILHSL